VNGLRTLRHPGLVLLIAAGLGIAAPAMAEPVVLPPLIAASSVDGRERALIDDTLATELDFAPGFDRVIRLDRRPSTLTTRCLTKASCLSRVAKASGARAMVAGAVKQRGRLFWLDLVLLDGERLVRSQTFSVPTDPTGLANAMGPVVRELLTGSTVEEEEAAPDVDFDDLDEFEDVPVGPAPADDEPVEIQFGRPDVATQPLDDEDEELPDEPLEAPGTDEPRVRDRAAEREAERRSRARERERERAARRQSAEGEAEHRVQGTARLGYANYYAFNFVTAGGEVAVRAFDGLHFVGGVGAWIINRELPPEEQVIQGRLREWDAIFPLHLGFLYKFRGDAEVRPYAGLEVIFAQYYQDDFGSDWAGGPRVRGGVDWMISDRVGLNADVAFGGWLGQNWPFIDERLQPAGFVPQITIGPMGSF